jgi:hypothetical protein
MSFPARLCKEVLLEEFGPFVSVRYKHKTLFR